MGYLYTESPRNYLNAPVCFADSANRYPAPEQEGEALGQDGAVLALPDRLLKMLPDEVLATLSPEARERVRLRIGR